MPSSPSQDTPVFVTEHARLDATPTRLWPMVAKTVSDWAHSRGIAMRDVVVLLPFAQLLGPARQAWAALPGWMPRIETTRTLSASLPPGRPGPAGQLSFDAALDALVARRLLARQAWVKPWAQRDPGALAAAAARLALTAQALARVAFAMPPADRSAYWQRARAAVEPRPGIGGTEALLVRVAIEWAALAESPTDALFELWPGAWVLVQAGRSDPLATCLVERAGTPALVIDTDPSMDDVMADVPSLSVAPCHGFEDEAQAAAAQVFAHVCAGERPVALIAQDRELVRRVHALLARQGVEVADETGWRLSTTRAGALVMAWLRAARASASTDEVLDALLASAPYGTHEPVLPALDAALRKAARARRAQVDCERFDPAAAALWREVTSRLDTASMASRAPLAVWNRRLRQLLDGYSPSSPAQPVDAAWLQLEQALHWHTPQADLPEDRLAFEEFVGWVEAALEAGVFVPKALREQAEVVITPLAQATLRPFRAVVFPGCDEKHLGAMPAPDPLLGDATARSLGLQGVQERRLAECRAFCQVLRAPSVTLTWRCDDGDGPLAMSPFLEQLVLAWRRRTDRGLPTWDDKRTGSAVDATPSTPSVPTSRFLPERLSASHTEALRACPYRFFALAVLGLREVDEFDDDPQKSDYGSWLHAVLHRFHAERQALGPGDGGDFDAQTRALRAAGAVERQRLGLDDAAFLPYAASFEAFVSLYLPWLRAREARGLVWSEGELPLAMRAAPLGSTELHGRIDRVDRDLGKPGTLELIDYKTGGASALKARLRDPQEDTQLAFYAALVHARESGAAAQARPLRAFYLALDDPRKIHEIEHPDVQASAQALLDGLGLDLERLRHGAGMPALGEGETCDYCEARGLCRRDDWAPRASGQDGA